MRERKDESDLSCVFVFGSFARTLYFVMEDEIAECLAY